MNLRPYQTTALSAVATAFRTHRRVLLQMPTGAGKTVCFTEYARPPGRVAIVAHRRELIRQALQKCLEAGLDAAVYPSAQPGRVTVGSIQTFARRLDQLPRFDRIVIDEAHHAVAGQYAAFLASQPEAEVLGVTATPERLDGRGLGTVFQHMVVGPSVRELTEAGHLAPALVYGPPARLDLSGVRTVAGEYHAADLEQLMSRPSLLGSAPEHYEKLAAGRRAIVFCVSVRHAEETAAAFRAEGWRFRCVHGGMTEQDRDAAFADLRSGRLMGLTSCALIDEGLDIPDVGCVVDLAPTMALGRFLQRAGRASRPAPGKRDYVLLDHAGNSLRHGLPGQDREWSLTAEKRRGKQGPAVVQCPGCFAMHSPAPACPACGHDYEREAREVQARELERVAGELALLTEEDRRMKMLREKPLAVLLKDARTHAHLEEIAKARGFKPAWVDVRSRYLPAAGGAGAADGSEFA